MIMSFRGYKHLLPIVALFMLFILITRGEIISYDGFENGWGNFNDGGGDVQRSSKDSKFAYAGSYAIQLRDNSGIASSLYTNDFNVSDYSEIIVSFTFIGSNMEFNETFRLEYSVDSGNSNSWKTESAYVFGSDYENNEFYQDVVTWSFPSSANNMMIRFRCDASSNNDWVYIDEVTIEGIPTGTSTVAPSPIDTNTLTLGDAWINEFHYDNIGADVDEFIEIAYTNGVDIASYHIVLYNGNGGKVYNIIDVPVGTSVQSNKNNNNNTINLSVMSGFRIQNGPDGIALVDGKSNVLEFLSYEGIFEAMDGPAAGIISTDIGKVETGSTEVGLSLQRYGTGCKGSDFSWQDPDRSTPGSLYDPWMTISGCKSVPSSPPPTFSPESNPAPAPAPAPNNNNDVKVMTYNILKGGITNSAWKDIVKKENADIIVFTEVGNWDNDNDALLNQYLDEFNSYFSTVQEEEETAYYVGSTVQGLSFFNTANAIMSRFPIVQTWQLTDAELSNYSAHDIMVWKLDVGITTKFVYVFGIHLKCCGGIPNNERRNQTMRYLIEWIDDNTNDTDGIMLMGDFNSVSPVDTDPVFEGYQPGFNPSSGSNLNDGPLRMLLDSNEVHASNVHTFKDAFREANPTCGSNNNCCADTLCDSSILVSNCVCPERGYTYISKKNNYDSRIDFIIVNQQVQVTGPATVGDLGGDSVCTASDHLPVDSIVSFF